MDELIKKSDAVDAFKTAMATSRWNGKSMVLKILDALPAVDAIERKRGEWIADEVGTTICSECRKPRRDNRADHIAFCNSCGADMRTQPYREGGVE